MAKSVVPVPSAPDCLLPDPAGVRLASLCLAVDSTMRPNAGVGDWPLTPEAAVAVGRGALDSLNKWTERWRAGHEYQVRLQS